MKLNFMFTVAIIILNNPIFSQTKYNEEYVKSFPQMTRGNLIKFHFDFQKDKRMTREEALKFVYNGDTTQLVCVREEYNMMTEKLLGISREERMPYKCMFLDMGDYLLIVNSSFDCHDPKKPQVAYLTLTVVNKEFKPTDALIVRREKYDMPEVLGELNSKNGMIFLVGFLKTKDVNPSDRTVPVHAAMLMVDKRSLKFKLLKESSGIKGNYTDFPKTLKSLGWEEMFLAEH